MAEQTKKSKYNFGGHELDAKLYLQNIRDNAETFLNSKTDWTPEQKEEWKHAYTNFTNALQEDINNGGGRFSTDEFGTITDTKGEFSNTDSDNYYYNNKGQQISQEDYDALKKRKQNKYQTFEANRQFASYASQIGKGLREALATKNKTSDDTNGFDYAKNGFDAYWQKKYNPAGTANDLQPYWNKDKEGEYTNRVAETMADLDDYMSKQEMNDDVKAAYTNYRNILGQYNPNDKNFNLDTWKNNMILAASRAGISGWNNGYFNIGSQSSASSEPDKKQAFDISDDDQALAYAGLTDQALAHPELRDTLLAQARRKYEQESQAIIDQDKAEQRQLQEAAHNKIWEQYLLNNPYVGDVRKRRFDANHTYRAGLTFTGTGISNDQSKQALQELGNALGRPADSDDWFLTSITNPKVGARINNLGLGLAYYLPFIESHPEYAKAFGKYVETTQDLNNNTVYKVRNSKNKKGEYLYFTRPKGDATVRWYRSKSYQDLKNSIPKAQWGFKVQTWKEVNESNENKKKAEDKKTISNPQTPHDKKVALIKQEKIGGNPFSDKATALRALSLLTDVGSTTASFSGVGAPASAISGAISTGMNQTADMLEGQGFLESLGNNALSYGMDVLSAIPFVKGITGTGRVIAKAAKLAPHIITALGAISVLKNKDAYIGSWKKITSTPDQLTRQDWSNIYDSLKLLTAGTRAGTQAIKGNRAMKGALSKDKVKVKTNEGYVVVDKSKLEGIKGTKGLEAQNKALQKATGNSNLRFNAARNKYRFWKTKDQAKIKEADVYDFTKPNTRMINGVEYERPYKWGELGIANHQWQSPKWMNGILDKIEVRGLKPTGRTQASIDRQAARQRSNRQPSDAQFVARQTKTLRDEWKANNATNSEYQQLKASIERARKLAASEQAAGRVTQANAYRNQAQQDIESMRNLTPEYNRLRSMVQNGNITFTGKRDVSRQVTQAWNDILKKYGVKYKQGGSIQKLANGNNINGNPWYSGLSTKGDFDVNKYKYNYDTNQLYAGDMSNGPSDFYVSNQKGQGVGRYTPTNNTFGQSVMDIENQDYYQKFGEDLLDQDGNFTPMGEKWAKTVDAQLPPDSPATFYDSTGKLRAKWTVKNNDSLNRPAESYTNLADYVKRVRNDQILGARHNVFLNTGNRYFYKDKKGVQHWVDPEDIKNYQVSEKPVTSGWNDDKTVYWNDYELTGPHSQVNPAENNKDKPGFKFNNPINKQLIIDMMDQIRVNNAINANDRIAATLKQSPILYDPQEDHRYVQSDLDAEMNGQQAAAQLARTASHPITSDGNLQSMLQLEATAKGNDAVIAGRQQSNQRLREMQEQAWQQEVANHTNRHDVAMKNRESLYNTINYNKQIDATNINANYTIQDARAQEAILPYKQDQEIRRAEQKSQRDRLAMRQIDDSLRLGLGKYASSYNLSPDDVQLWEDVYVNGSKTLDDIKKNPVLTKRWNNIKYTVGQIQNDLIGDYYGVPRSKYWTIRQSTPFYEYSTKAKKGAKLNLRKVREAAKGEKLAVAQLKAQTADADRFYKTTKDHIDRMYAAISRTMNYSSTKKKRKKKKNYDI